MGTRTKISLAFALLLHGSFAFGQMGQYGACRELVGVKELWHKLVLPDDLFKGPQAPTALLADGTRLLRAVLQGLRRFGLAVPQDRSVIGIDTEEASSLTTPETTTLVRDFAAVGRAAAELMLQRLGDRASPPQQRSLESRLVLAGSCAAPPRSDRR